MRPVIGKASLRPVRTWCMPTPGAAPSTSEGRYGECTDWWKRQTSSRVASVRRTCTTMPSTKVRRPDVVVPPSTAGLMKQGGNPIGKLSDIGRLIQNTILACVRVPVAPICILRVIGRGHLLVICRGISKVFSYDLEEFSIPPSTHRQNLATEPDLAIYDLYPGTLAAHHCTWADVESHVWVVYRRTSVTHSERPFVSSDTRAGPSRGLFLSTSTTYWAFPCEAMLLLGREADLFFFLREWGCNGKAH